MPKEVASGRGPLRRPTLHTSAARFQMYFSGLPTLRLHHYVARPQKRVLAMLESYYAASTTLRGV